MNKWVQALVGVIAVGVVGAILYPVFAKPGSFSGRSDLSSMKQLALIGMIYSGDFDDIAPPAKGWVGALYPYAKNKNVFVCAHLSGKPHQFGHALFVGAAGQNLKKIPRPESYPFFFDSRNLSMNAVSELHELSARGRPRRATIAFADGHVRDIVP